MEQTVTDVPVSAGKISLYKKLLQVYQDVRYIQKDGNNSFHKYRYVTEAGVKDKLHDAFVKNGLLFHFSITDLNEVVDGKNRLVTIKTYFKFIDADTGEELEGTSYGTGVDSLDKGLYKAIAGGIKYILTSNFLIPTGDDPEDDKYEKEQAEEQTKATKSKANGKASKTQDAPPPPAPPAPVQQNAGTGSGAECHVCGEQIADYTSSKGKVFSADVLVSESTKKYGVPMCASCQVAKGKEAQQGAGARVQ